jgi:NCS2 family nucleobase:cation symporter-2
MKKEIQYTSPHNFYGLIPLKDALPLGIQHVLSMFVGNMTPLLLICGACKIDNSDPELFIVLLQNAMLVAGLVTLVQLYSIGPVGGKVPIVMGTSSSFLGIFQVIIEKSGGGILAYGLILGASIVGGLVEALLGFFIKPLRKLFPPVVTGIVVLTIGLSLIPIGVQSFAGGMDSPDFGSVENVLIALAVMTVTILVKHFTKGTLHRSAVLAGILFGYVLCSLLAFILPTTGVAADGTAFTKAWVIPWDKVAEAK